MRDPIERAEHAQRLLDDELLREAFSLVDQAIVDKWLESSVKDAETHHELKLMHTLLKQVRGALTKALNDGKVEIEKRKRFGLF